MLSAPPSSFDGPVIYFILKIESQSPSLLWLADNLYFYQKKINATTKAGINVSNLKTLRLAFLNLVRHVHLLFFIQPHVEMIHNPSRRSRRKNPPIFHC